MGYDDDKNSILFHTQKKTDINILIVGPPNSGKTSLIKTMNFAINGNVRCNV